MNAIDRLVMALSPRHGLERVRARANAQLLQRHFEAAQPGRRTEGWSRRSTDANAANAPALGLLRSFARDLVRNNGWAKRCKQVIANNMVGWGIQATPVHGGVRVSKRAMELWERWAGTTACDVEGIRTFSGIQRLVAGTVAESGEALLRRYRRPLSERLPIPLQIQVLESDYLDTGKDGIRLENGGRIIQGVEYDKVGRRVAYWLFPEHPGSSGMLGRTVIGGLSERVAAADVRHVYLADRPGQVRGVTWFAPAIVTFKDFDEYEDATLLRQKIAACFAAFVTDVDGVGSPLGARSESNPLIETIEPGIVVHVPNGKNVEFANPPTVVDSKFDSRQLRRIAAGLGVTYEDLTGDYSNVNFSSARMARLSHWANVHDWRWNMLIPQLCDGVWAWAMEAALMAGELDGTPGAKWTPPPMPMIDPDKEGLAYQRLVRAGVMTHADMVQEQGGDPERHWQEYADGLAMLDKHGIVLDSDARKTTQAGNVAAAGEQQDGAANGSKSDDK